MAGKVKRAATRAVAVPTVAQQAQAIAAVANTGCKGNPYGCPRKLVPVLAALCSGGPVAQHLATVPRGKCKAYGQGTATLPRALRNAIKPGKAGYAAAFGKVGVAPHARMVLAAWHYYTGTAHGKRALAAHGGK